MKKALFLMAALATSGAFAAPFVWPASWSASKPSEAKRGGELRQGVLSDFKTFNPFTTTEAGNVPFLIGDSTSGLFTQDPTSGNFVPYMADGPAKVSNGNKRFVVTIRQGMKFSDGQEITADDWVTTAKIHKDDKVGSNSYDNFYINNKPINVTKLGKYQLQFDFPSVSAGAYVRMSYAPWPDHVFGKVYASGGAEAIKKMWTLSTPVNQIVSPGAWSIASYRAGERTVVKKNPYWGEWNKDSAGGALPYLDTQSFLVAKDLNGLLAQFLSGNVDLYNPDNADRLSQVKAAIDGKKLDATLLPNVSPNATSSWIVFNWNQAKNPSKQALFRNPKFRYAMSMLANRKAMVQLALGGVGSEVYTSVYPVFADWIPKDVKTYPYNPQMAAKLLSDLGYKKKDSQGWLVNSKGERLEFNLTTNSGNTIREQTARIFADEAKKVGVKVNFNPIDFNTLVDQLDSTGDNRPFDAILLGLSGGDNVWPFGSNVEPCGTNLHSFNGTPKCITPQETLATKLYNQGDQELDVTKRKAIGAKLVAVDSEMQGFIYLIATNYHVAYNNRVGGQYPRELMDAYYGSRATPLTFVK